MPDRPHGYCCHGDCTNPATTTRPMLDAVVVTEIGVIDTSQPQVRVEEWVCAEHAGAPT